MDYQEIKTQLEDRAREYALNYAKQYNVTDSTVIEAVRQSHYVCLVAELNRVLRDGK